MPLASYHSTTLGDQIVFEPTLLTQHTQRRRRPQAVRRHLLPSLAAADREAGGWDAAELAWRLPHSRRLLPALLRGLRHIAEAAPPDDDAAPAAGGAAKEGAAPPPQPLEPQPRVASPCQRLRASYHRHVESPARRSPGSASRSPQRQQRGLEEETTGLTPMPSPSRRPRGDGGLKASVARWLGEELGLLPPLKSPLLEVRT